MSDPKLLTAERLRELLHYDEATGIFTRRTTPARGKWKAGEKVGYSTNKGYIATRVDKNPYQIHRLVWLWMTGEWPDGLIDHINRDKADNRFANLRVVDNQTNMQNIEKARSSNKSTGVLGVFFEQSSGRYSAQIQIGGGKIKKLGRYATVDLAQAAYLEAKARLHPGWVP